MKYSIFLGATSDLAQNFIQKFLDHTENIILVAKNHEKLKKLFFDCKKKIVFFTVDFSNLNEILNLINKIDNKNFEINFLGNFLGKSYSKEFHLNSNIEILQTINVNVLPYILFVNYLINKSIKNNTKLQILNIGSLAGINPSNKMLTYSLAKNFIHKLSDVLNYNYSSKNIQFFLVILGQVDTKFLKNSNIKKKNNDILTIEEVSSYILKELKKNNYLIIPGFINKLRFYILKYLMPSFILNLFHKKNYYLFK